ncbi:MAG: Ca2+-dependent phosphoinositide-specific phospholipase C [Gemmatimonadota bacterium]
MSLEELRYDQVAFKGTHNSIDRDKSIIHQLSATGGVVGRCAALELDLHQHPDRWDWEVKHGSKDVGVPLREVLQKIAGWSDRHRKHSVVTIHLDLKNAPKHHAAFAAKLDGLLLDVVGPQRIYPPGKVIGGHPDLVRGARAGGWAKMKDLRGRLIFCLSGRVARKSAYARTDPRSRTCFTDFAGSVGPSKRGHSVFANLFVDAKHYLTHLDGLVQVPGFVTRGYNIVTARNWQRSMEHGLNILSTDVLQTPSFSLGTDGRVPLRVLRP